MGLSQSCDRFYEKLLATVFFLLNYPIEKMKSFEEKYLYISAWVLDGQIEIGYGEYDDVFIRAIDGRRCSLGK